MGKKIVVLLITGFMLMGAYLSSEELKEAADYLRKMDRLYQNDSSYAEIVMKIETPNWKRSLKIKSWSLGSKRTFLRILEPKKERGIATLKIGKKMWNFLPKIDKVMKIPPSMMMSSWMGSDFTNDDFTKVYTLVDDYTHKFIKNPVGEDEAGVVYIECVPKEGRPIIWGKRVIAIRKKSVLPVWEKFYDGKGKVVREMAYRDVKRFGKKDIPSVMELVPVTKKDSKTTIIFVKAEFDIPVDEKIFSRRNLRKRI